MNKIYGQDLYRYYGGKMPMSERLLPPPNILYIKTLRLAQHYRKHNKLLYIYYKLKLKRLQHRTSIQIPEEVEIGPGFYIGHYGSIVINPKAILGKNINIANGVTIGQENRGKRIGVPTISDNVWIGTNATVIGKITIGNDVLIAPNSYVNFDVPDHSIVIGNPARIIPRENATEGYINRTI